MSLQDLFKSFHDQFSDEEQDREETRQPKKERYYGTVKSHPNFNARKNAEVLQSAIKTKGVEEEVIISVLVQISNKQRQMIKPVYQSLTGKDLEKDLKCALKYDLEDVCMALLMSPASFDAYCLRKATKRLGTDEEVLIEILVSRTNQEIRDIKKAFKAEYKKDLEDVIKDETDGHFAKALLELLKADRDESKGFNESKAREDAETLNKALQGDVDIDTLIDILTSRSWRQLDETIKLFPTVGDLTFGKTLEKKLRGDIEDCLLQIAKCAWNISAYFAEKLHRAMERHGTCEDTLTRVLVARSEIDLKKILDQFKRLYGKSVQEYIMEDTRGHHEAILLGLCGPK